MNKLENEKQYSVINRSAGVTGYKIPEMNVRRIFEPQEVKQISGKELFALS